MWVCASQGDRDLNVMRALAGEEGGGELPQVAAGLACGNLFLEKLPTQTSCCSQWCNLGAQRRAKAQGLRGSIMEAKEGPLELRKRLLTVIGEEEFRGHKLEGCPYAKHLVQSHTSIQPGLISHSSVHFPAGAIPTGNQDSKCRFCGVLGAFKDAIARSRCRSIRHGRAAHDELPYETEQSNGSSCTNNCMFAGRAQMFVQDQELTALPPKRMLSPLSRSRQGWREGQTVLH